MKSKKVQILFLLLLLLNQFIHADNIEHYFGKIYTAEHKILSLDFKGALIEYQIINNKYSNMFVKDINNGFNCAIKAKNWRYSYVFFKKLLKMGVDTSYLSKERFKEFKQSRWGKVILKEFQMRFKQKTYGNKNLKEMIDTMHFYDQKYRKSNDLINTIAIDSINSIKLIKILEHSFPKEKDIGVIYENQNKKGIDFAQNNFIVLLIHQVRNKNIKIIDSFEKAVLKGYIEPWKLSLIAGLVPSIGLRFGCTSSATIIQINGECYSCPQLISHLNKDRKRYYLPSVQKILEFDSLYTQNKVNLNGFFFPLIDANKVSVEFPSEEIKQNFIDSNFLEKIKSLKIKP